MTPVHAENIITVLHFELLPNETCEVPDAGLVKMPACPVAGEGSPAA